MRKIDGVSKVMVFFTALAASGVAQAGQAGPELGRTLEKVRSLRQAGETGRAEALLEALTRSRSEDPRSWYALAELRAGLGAQRAATYAFHRAAGLASPRRRQRIRRRLEALKLPTFPERDQVGDAEEFELRAQADACAGVRRHGIQDEELACDGAGQAGRDYRLSADLFARFARDPRAWIRAEAYAHAPFEALSGPFVQALAGELDTRVREAFLRRVVQASGELELDGKAMRAIEAMTWDERFEVRQRAWTALFEQGRVPTLTADDFRRLVPRADLGQASRDMLRAIFQAQKDEFFPVLSEFLTGASHDGKVAAIMLLCLDAGREGQMEVALAFTAPSSTLGNYWGHARRALVVATRDEDLELGEDPVQWVEVLSR